MNICDPAEMMIGVMFASHDPARGAAAESCRGHEKWLRMNSVGLGEELHDVGGETFPFFPSWFFGWSDH